MVQSSGPRQVVSRIEFEQFSDKAGCLQLVERLDALTETLLRQVFDDVLIEFVLFDYLQDEFLLGDGAFPVMHWLARVMAVTVVSWFTITIRLVVLGLRFRQVADCLDGLIDGVLELV